MFIQYLAQQGHNVVKSERKPRKVIQYKDLATAVSRIDNLEFLADVIPKTTTYKQFKEKKAKEASRDAAFEKGQRTLNGTIPSMIKENGEGGHQKADKPSISPRAPSLKSSFDPYAGPPFNLIEFLPSYYSIALFPPQLSSPPPTSPQFIAIASLIMSLSSASSTLLRACARQQLPTTRAAVASCQQRRGLSEASKSSSFDSPFGSSNDYQSTLKIPSFSKYASNKPPRSNQVFSYFMAGALGLGSAVGAKATVQDFLVNMSASADVLAQAKVEIGLASIPEGKNVIIKWRGKPVFIRHRTQDEIQEAQQYDWKTLRDPQPDEDRVQKPEWLVMLGVCTHLGCVPIGESGDYGGWFCPCHGSHYDISGRVRKGPAPLNLEVPQYSFPDESTLVIG
ncbi:hypothetical protein CNMCM8980_004370 [Aspergillus fumigatiaffinis]|uniref:Cytochrome b-c1 complex subunit Rieske, mitochondrial n=2 Tax=Aspergillus subgen. Fumigati TaxID=2720872 RepID=A0A8H4HEG0_9EURO|nr:hypothetical protein CNMCM6457_002984 [Aspergillus fumigatiaffinis]KAF4220282.1 hypothetical protein CNMCM5878_001761 [Aspergillus fumigatiaffinis]KAF4241626.1 hypothetical protein CNMCM6805_003900 [Aspergillus fumigatiaffinis]KAF4249104.1 hypothetical protein CNMCM8980_004370 [Aspergillus fumigatiaffinis]